MLGTPKEGGARRCGRRRHLPVPHLQKVNRICACSVRRGWALVAANAALERMGRRIQEATFLKRKGGSPVKAARVVALPAGQALLAIVFFPRTEALSVEDEEVSFEAAGGTIAVKAAFNLRTMVFRGGLEL